MFDKENFLDFLNKQKVKLRCPICGGKKFLTDEASLMCFIKYSEIDDQIKPQTAYPVGILMCEKCTHNLTFSATSFGFKHAKDPIQ